MENAVNNRLRSVRFGEPQTYKNIVVVPLITPANGTFQYRTLGEVLANWDVAIAEVSATGSVPELLVVNRGNKPVLLIDGEELAGAKQNRVLNTSILLKEVSETKIPVSCTEQGRWSYASKMFSESGNVMARKSRARKSRSVLRSLETCGTPVSNQGEVWDGIAELQAEACTQSPTSAMSDVFKAREDQLRACDDVFKRVSNQVGLLAIIDGRAVGLDLVSLTVAYTRIDPKLVRSYTLEGLLDSSRPPRRRQPGPVRAGKGTPESPPGTPLPSRGSELALAQSFLDEMFSAEERQFASVGYGTDFRYRLVAPKPGVGGSASPHSLAGSALVHAGEVVHAAVFRLDDPPTMNNEPSTRLASYRQRRGYNYE